MFYDKTKPQDSQIKRQKKRALFNQGIKKKKNKEDLMTLNQQSNCGVIIGKLMSYVHYRKL